MKSDTTAADPRASIEYRPTDDTYMNKPDTKDDLSTVYDKPNEYDVDEHKQTLPQEVLDDLIVRPQFINGKRPDIKTNDEDEESGPQSQQSHHSKIPLLLLAQRPATAITGVTIHSMDDINPSTSDDDDSSHTKEDNASIKGPTSIDITAASTKTPTGHITSKMALLQILKKEPMEELLNYDLRKASLTRPFDHDIYFHKSNVLAFKKLQPHSYSWGFQNILYRTCLESNHNQLDDKSIKIAEARRRAFQKEITIEWGDFPTPATCNASATDLHRETSDPIVATDSASNKTNSTSTLTKSSQLENRTKSHLHFVYDMEFEGYCIRWKRVSLLSHDLICELRPKDENSLSNSDNGQYGTNRTGKKKWRLIAKFDSHRLGYLVFLGTLSINKHVLKLVERPDHLEAHIMITCCTLIDNYIEMYSQLCYFRWFQV
ncbi:hypothetical protein BDF20DRAFT_890187, partial [Mycotypha africana]|uniref:uncharacterized protein n=1 Tax=Mycotypha africana TaxID=64632 RepID=UPI002301F184